MKILISFILALALAGSSIYANDFISPPNSPWASVEGDTPVTGTIRPGNVTQPPGNVPPVPEPPGDGTGGGGGGTGTPGDGSTNLVITRPVITPPIFGYHLAPYIFGYPDGTVRPNIGITRGEITQILYTLIEIDDTVALYNPFDDVSEEAFYHNAVAYLTSLEIIRGYPDGTFRPEAVITRAEFIRLVSGVFNMPLSSIRTPFSDLDSSHWAFTEIMGAYSSGYVVGYPDGTFRPNNSLSRTEAVIVLNNATGRNDFLDQVDPTEERFTDLTPDFWGFRAVMLASQYVIREE